METSIRLDTSSIVMPVFRKRLTTIFHIFANLYQMPIKVVKRITRCPPAMLNNFAQALDIWVFL